LKLLQFPFISYFTIDLIYIGCEKINNIPEIFSGVHGLTGKTVSFPRENVAYTFVIKSTFQNSWVFVIHPFPVVYKIRNSKIRCYQPE